MRDFAAFLIFFVVRMISRQLSRLARTGLVASVALRGRGFQTRTITSTPSTNTCFVPSGRSRMAPFPARARAALPPPLDFHSSRVSTNHS